MALGAKKNERPLPGGTLLGVPELLLRHPHNNVDIVAQTERYEKETDTQGTKRAEAAHCASGTATHQMEAPKGNGDLCG